MASFDVIIIGGGATGLGCALDATSRGLKTLLLEQADFATASSSRSTKLIHGGLRYLQQGDIALVMEALAERGILCKNAPHLIAHLPFLVPNYKWWEGPFYGAGLKLYDLLAGQLGIEKSRHLSKDETISKVPNIAQADLRGASLYFDGQFDDARLAITLAKTAQNRGALLRNYTPVTSLIKSDGKIVGVRAGDEELHASHVINATGVFTDELRILDDPNALPLMSSSQGVHLVLPETFLSHDTALLIPHTSDDRLLFLVPWENRLLAGTTDRATKTPLLEPLALDEEIDFILETASRYLTKKPKRSDVLSVFAGLRPLVNPSGSKKTASLSRGHFLTTSDSGLITITGGKWTTYRKMAEDTIDLITNVPSITENLPLDGFSKTLCRYGSHEEHVQSLGRAPLSLKLPYTEGEVIYAVREEMAKHLEDVLSRRTRALLLDAKESIQIAPRVAAIMAKELGKDEAWVKKEVGQFIELAQNYLPR